LEYYKGKGGNVENERKQYLILKRFLKEKCGNYSKSLIIL